MTWDILICSIEQRTDLLTGLLEELVAQIEGHDGVNVRVCRDNLERGYGQKCQALLDSSQATYVSFIDDDDLPSSDYVESISEALTTLPDYVGFKVEWSENGHQRSSVSHSLKHAGWLGDPERLVRDLSHLNPIKRELASLSYFDGETGAERRWAERLRVMGCVKTEVFIDRELYRYIWVGAHSMQTQTLIPMGIHPPQPEFPYTTFI